MLLTVADGLIAEEFDRRTRIGPYVNRLPQDIGDAALFAACLAWADPGWVVLLLGAAWLVNVAGVLPAIAGGSFQPVGPAGQPDRITIVLRRGRDPDIRGLRLDAGLRAHRPAVDPHLRPAGLADGPRAPAAPEGRRWTSTTRRCGW